MRKSSALDALFPRIRQALLAATLLHPERRWYLGDLARHLQVSPSSLQRDLSALVGAGILQRQRDGNRVYYQPDPSCPFLPELQGLLIKTAGLSDVLKDALEPFNHSIVVAFVYGSVASSEEGSASDVDLMIVGTLRLAEMAPALREAERMLQRPINPTLYTREEFARKAADGNHFLQSVLRGEKIFVKGNQHELDAACGGPQVEAAHDLPQTDRGVR